MFGMQFTGANICGTINGTVSEDRDELCARWVQLGAFYPFSRQHATGNNEIWKLKGDYSKWVKDAMTQRYMYLRHMYTCLFEASQTGQTCFDPLLFHYPDDDEVYNNIENTFIVGDALKIAPVLEKGN